MRLLGGVPSTEVTQGSPPRTQRPKPAAAVEDSSVSPAAPSDATAEEPAGAESVLPKQANDASAQTNEPTGPPDAAPPIPSPKKESPITPVAPSPKKGETAKPDLEPEPGQTAASRPADEEMLPAAEPKPPAAQAGVEPPVASDVPPSSPTAPAAATPVEVGYVKLSDPHFIIRYVPESDDWFRLPARSRLMSGDRLVVFPTYRPEIVLTPGVQVVLAGPSSVQLQAAKRPRRAGNGDGLRAAC